MTEGLLRLPVSSVSVQLLYVSWYWGVVKRLWTAKQSPNLKPARSEQPLCGDKTFKGVFDLFRTNNIPLSACSWADRKLHDSHGYWIQNVGMGLFLWNKEISAIYSRGHTGNLVPTKTEADYIKKKDQWTVIVLSFPSLVSFPVLHQMWHHFPWWKRQHLPICLVSIMSTLSLLCLYVAHWVEKGGTFGSSRGHNWPLDLSV